MKIMIITFISLLNLHALSVETSSFDSIDARVNDLISLNTECKEIETKDCADCSPENISNYCDSYYDNEFSEVTESNNQIWAEYELPSSERSEEVAIFGFLSKSSAKKFAKKHANRNNHSLPTWYCVFVRNGKLPYGIPCAKTKSQCKDLPVYTKAKANKQNPICMKSYKNI